MFGTDGIRSTANKFPMQPQVVMKVSQAAASYFSTHAKPNATKRVLVCKDTRLSGYMFENAVTSGLVSMGFDVYLLGPMPTPALAFLVRSMRADFGVMITASHNAYCDNGLKIIDRNGFKISRDIESGISEIYNQDISDLLSIGNKIGRAFRLRGTEARYLQHIKSFFPDNLDLSELTIVVDCANGASYKVAPDVLFELNAKKVIPLCVEPNGININNGCGSTHIENAQKEVLLRGADVGVAFDGDADRLIMVDEKGNVVDGDVILGIISKYWKETGQLKGNTLVGTITTNSGLADFCKSLGIDFIRTDVGDKNIIPKLRDNGFNLGGEISGHVVLLDRTTTSDGIAAALEVLKIMVTKKVPLSQLAKEVTLCPQICTDVEGSCDGKNLQKILYFAEQLEKKSGHMARILVRKSGTEKKMRIVTEGETLEEAQVLSDKVEEYIKKFI